MPFNDVVFLGRTISGVSDRLAANLADVNAEIQAQFDALTPEERVDPITSAVVNTVSAWVGFKSAGAFRPNAGFHTTGDAVDINVESQPYIATRSGSVLGGENTSLDLSEQRRKAVEACDRACQFALGDSAAADLANRHPGETTGSVYERFAAVSNAVSLYLSFGINTAPTRVNRIWVSDADTLNVLALTALMGGELQPQEDALANIREFLGSDGYKTSHAEQPDPNDVYRNLLVDYELVRAPMVFGSPSLLPASTRNPARGFLNIRRELVVSLCDTGKLRWGASDFGVAGGHSENGDVMHFDVGQRAEFA
jgi:hypothetical protein